MYVRVLIPIHNAIISESHYETDTLLTMLTRHLIEFHLKQHNTEKIKRKIQNGKSVCANKTKMGYTHISIRLNRIGNKSIAWNK